jgi:hypothetical protein
METPKYIEYDGLRFCRDDKTGYYLNSTIRKRLHRYVWEKEVGKIPYGCQIHHINGNKADNRIDNLAIMTASGHQRLHGAEIARKERCRENIKQKALPAAIEWHKSEAGRAWHSEHALGKKTPRYKKICEVCGAEYDGTKQQKFCSNACKSKYRRQSELDHVLRKCEFCGKEFYADKYSTIKFCSVECQHKAHIGWRKRKYGH